jgi:hypothetical protein
MVDPDPTGSATGGEGLQVTLRRHQRSQDTVSPVTALPSRSASLTPANAAAGEGEGTPDQRAGAAKTRRTVTWFSPLPKVATTREFANSATTWGMSWAA